MSIPRRTVLATSTDTAATEVILLTVHYLWYLLTGVGKGQELEMCLCPYCPMTVTLPWTESYLRGREWEREGFFCSCSAGILVKQHTKQTVTEERTQGEVGEHRGRALRGLGTAGTTKLSLCTHTVLTLQSFTSNQRGRKCLQDLSWVRAIINDFWIASEASGVAV